MMGKVCPRCKKELIRVRTKWGDIFECAGRPPCGFYNIDGWKDYPTQKTVQEDECPNCSNHVDKYWICSNRACNYMKKIP